MMACKSALTTCTQRNGSTKLILHAFVVLNLVILSQLTLLEGAGVEKRESGQDVTIPAENQSCTQNVTKTEERPVKSNTGAIVAICIICVIVCITIVLAVYFFKRKRQSRMMDKEKKMQIQMSSARNAGVYQDLTVSVPMDEKPPASPEHERLKEAEDA